MAKKEKIGIIVSSKMKNTLIVAVNECITNHIRYKKSITRSKRYAVHDAMCEATLGDQVQIQETKPISRTKNWVLVDVFKKISQI